MPNPNGLTVKLKHKLPIGIDVFVISIAFGGKPEIE